MIAIWLSCAYLVVGFPFGLTVAAREARRAARKGVKDEAAEAFAVCWLIWPVVLCVMAFDGLAWFARRVARVDRLPEVVERRTQDLEREVQL